MKVALILVLLCVVGAFASPRTPKVSAPSDQCSECEQIVGFVEGWLENNSTDAEIQQYLDTLCKLIPGISAVCDQIAAWGLDYVIQFLKANGSPQVLCQQFGLCSSPIVVSVADSSCSGCLTLVGAIESWIASSATESEIEAALDAICQLVPNLDAPCEAIVSQLPTIIAYLEADGNATVLCQLLGLCPQQKAAVPKSAECGPCEALVSAIENWIAANKTEFAIEKDLLNVVCPMVPAFAATCTQIFKVGVPAAIAWITQAENPTTACTQLGVCPTALLKLSNEMKGSIVVN